jgi:hypothetical protein
MASETNVWDVLVAFAACVSAVGVVVGPIIANRRAKEVKEDLGVAKKELKQDAAVREAKLDAVHATAVKTEVLVNGDRLAMQLRIKELETKLRTMGIPE